MPNFSYQGRRMDGHVISGQINAANTYAASQQLIEKKIVPLHIKEVQDAWLLQITEFFTPKIDSQALQLFARQMHALLKSGLSIVVAIQGISKTTESEQLARILEKIQEQLTQGVPLSVAMHQYPKAFDALFVAMIHMGENTGNLDQVFAEISKYLEKQEHIAREISNATRYPTLVFMAILLAFVGMNLFVIPQFLTMFASMGGDVPVLTKVIMHTSNLFTEHGMQVLAVCLASCGLGYASLQSHSGQYHFDRFLLKLPIIGSLLNRMAMTRFNRCFSSMINSGLMITESLTLSAELVGNHYFKEKIIDMRQHIESGAAFTQVAHDSGIFPALVSQMIAVGEDSGQIGHLLSDVADFYEQELDYELKKLTGKIEPILIVCMGGLVTVLALGIYLPMWSLVDTL